MSLAERVLTRPKTTDPEIAKVTLPYATMVFVLKFLVTIMFHAPYMPVIPRGITLAFNWMLIPPLIELFGIHLFVLDSYFIIFIVFELMLQFLNAFVAGYLIALIIREHKPKNRYFELPYLAAEDSYLDLLKFFICWYVLFTILVIYPSYIGVEQIFRFILQGIYWIIGVFLMFTPYIIILTGNNFITSLKNSYKISTEYPDILLKSVIGSILLFSIFESVVALTDNFFIHFFATLFVGFPLLITLNNFIIKQLIQIEGVEVNEKNT